MEEIKINNIIRDSEITRISIFGLKDVPGVAFNLFKPVAERDIKVDIILQSIGRDDTKDISFTIAKNEKDAVLDVLLSNREILGFKDISVSENLCKVTISGSGMLKNSGFATKVFEALYEKNIEIHMISTSEISISVLVDSELANIAEQSIYNKLFKI
jgi:Aspartokinases